MLFTALFLTLAQDPTCRTVQTGTSPADMRDQVMCRTADGRWRPADVNPYMANAPRPVTLPEQEPAERSAGAAVGALALDLGARRDLLTSIPRAFVGRWATSASDCRGTRVITITETQLIDPLTRARNWPAASLTIRPTQIYYQEYVENPAFDQQEEGPRHIPYDVYIDVGADGGLTKTMVIGPRRMPPLPLVRCPT